MMDCAASGMPFLFVYLDNNIVASSLDIQSHVHYLHLLLESLHDCGGNKLRGQVNDVIPRSLINIIDQLSGRL